MSEQPASSGEAAPTPKLLVVDDNDDNRNLLSRRLRAKGYEVDLAADGPEALSACAKTSYDAIILDVMMPGMSGIEVLEKLREEHAKTELAVIMATAKNDSTSVVDALKRGANDYVTKPIDFPVLLARLETHLAMKSEAAERAAQVDVTFGIAPGTVLCNRYEILDKLGEGGFAVVYRARQLSTNREVALKHLRPDVLGAPGTEVQLERFERESQLIGEMNHPNIVRLIDSGRVSVRPAGPTSKGATPAAAEVECVEPKPGTEPEKNGAEATSRTRRRSPETDILAVPFIVMDLLSGESLGDVIDREAPMAATRAVDLMLPVLSALAAAHAKGVVHRDIKPSNIMVTPDDAGGLAPKILDFGIAKLTAREKQDLTVSASLLGTPQYMPPEQARGVKDLDGRTDQFAAAAVLYQMLTGHMLYAGESLLDIIIKVLAGQFVRLKVERPDSPHGLAEVIERALATEREDRYASITDLGRELMPYASERVARRWADHFDVPAPSTASEELAVSIVRSEPGGDMSLHPTLASPGPEGRAAPAAQAASAAKANAGAVGPTLELDRSDHADPLESAPPRGEGSLIQASPIRPLVRAEPSPRAVAESGAIAKAEARPEDAAAAEEEADDGAPTESTPDDGAPPKDAAAAEDAEAVSTESIPAPPPSAAPPAATAPPGTMTVLGMRMPWERFALIVLAAFALCYALARYVF